MVITINIISLSNFTECFFFCLPHMNRLLGIIQQKKRTHSHLADNVISYLMCIEYFQPYAFIIIYDMIFFFILRFPNRNYFIKAAWICLQCLFIYTHTHTDNIEIRRTERIKRY